MDYQTQIPTSAINPGELEELIGKLAKTMHVEYSVTTQYVVATNDGDFSDMLDRIADAVRARASKPAREGKAPKRKYNKQAKGGAKPLGLHSYRNEKTGEILSKQKINKMLAAHELAQGTRFTNGHGETFMVGKVDETQDGPFQLIIVGE